MLSIENVKVYAEGLDHPECVLCHPDGSVWAGGEGGQIYRVDEAGTVEEVARTGGFILGMALSPDRTWMAVCDLKKRCVWRLDMQSLALSLYSDGAAGHKFLVPNYPCFDSKQNLYVSESGTFRQVDGKILRFDSKGYGAIWHKGPFNFANGLALDRDEEFLYVVCTFAPAIERIAILEEGTAGLRETFVKFNKVVPDGIAFDISDNLFVACYAPNTILCVSPDRSVKVFVDDWEAHTLCCPTNIAFGGKSGKQLFVANLGRWHLGIIETTAKGLALPSHYS